MDFGELLHTAKKNEQAKPQIQYYSTKFSPPKKEHRVKTVSVNVQKFLARKEAEEKKKRVDAFDKRTKLLALRSQDKKATRRVNVMLKRTKSANQSVIADALDSDNTAVTLAGPSQPDEDDYGYVSQESSALYNKMMEKYNKMPDEPKFPEARRKISMNLSGTKDRVKAALDKEKEDALLPHRRKRKHVDGGDDGGRNVETNMEPELEHEKKDVTKLKFKPAPLVNFSDLLKLAEKKQFEPVVIEQKKEEEERPLTKKQKKEMEREKEWREKKESRNKETQEKVPTLNRIPKLNRSPSQNVDKNLKKVSFENQEVKKAPKIKENTSDFQNVKKVDRNLNIAKNSKTPILDISTDRKQPPHRAEANKKCDSQQRPLNVVKNSINKSFEKSKPETKANGLMPPPATPIQKSRAVAISDKMKSEYSRDLQRKTYVANSKPKQLPQHNEVNTKPIILNGLKCKPNLQNNLKPKQSPSSDLKPKQFPSNDIKSKQFTPNDPKQYPPQNLKPKQFPPSDLKPKQFPPPDIRRNPKDVKRKLILNKRRIMDDEDEYDPDMDDFIDDGPEDQQDYSKYISEIFGYDKRRYARDEDDVVDNMESSFAEQMKEEVISTKIGIMEDLEDMRQEEEAKKRKLLMKKRRKL